MWFNWLRNHEKIVVYRKYGLIVKFKIVWNFKTFTKYRESLLISFKKRVNFKKLYKYSKL